MARGKATEGNHDWLSMVRSSGLVVSLPVLNDVFRDGPEPVEPAMQRKFTRAWSRFQAGIEREREGAHREWIDFILRELLGLRDHLLKGQDIPAHLSHVLTDYDQTLRPDAALLDDEGNPMLLVGIVDPEQGLDRREARSGAWRASPFVKFDRLMREAGAKLGLLTNGHEFRLLHGPPGLGAAWLAWRAVDWSDESEMLDGFHTLLRAERFYGDEKRRLQKLVDDSQQKQLELTDQLGDQVRQALEVFLRAVDRADRAAGGALLSGMEHPQVYEMCLFTMMRMVFILYAEESYLLPHGEVIYDEAYGLTHLWQQLSEQQRNAPESLTDSFDAWPRLLAIFRLVHGGCPHPDLNMRPYGGHLFDPNRFPPLQDPRLQINNHVIFLLMQKLLFATARVGGQRGSHRLSYSALDIEQIGTVYEGLIAYTVRRTPDEQTMVVFEGKNDAMRPLSELETVTPADLKAYIIQQTGWTDKQAEKALEAMQQPSRDVPPPGIDSDLHERLLPYRPLIKLDETIPGGHLYVAHESGLRKGQGVYYTPKWITSYIVERTLEPLVYELDHGSLGEGPHEGSPASSAGQPRSAHAVLGDNEVLEGSAERRRHVVPATEGDRPGAVPEGPDAVLEGPVDRSPDVVPGATEPGPAVQVPATEGDRPAVDQSDEGMESADQSPSVPHTTAGRPSAGPSNTVMDSDAGTPSSREAETSAVSSGEGPLEPADAGEGPHEWTPPGRMGGVTRSAHVNQPSKGPESADQSPSVPQTAAGRPSAGPSNDATDAVASPSRRIKPPRDILDLKVCDPAMGSGAFLVQACRYLADRLVESWDLLASEHPDAALTLPYGDIADGSPGEIALPDNHEEAVTWARRFVAEHCLYGVDINPLAVELAKMSLWLITLAKYRAFEFLDHKLRPGNSLIGCWSTDLERYPVAAWNRKGAEGAVKDVLKQIRKDAKAQADRQAKDRAKGIVPLIGVDVAALRAETAAEMREIDAVSTFDPQQKEQLYRRNIEEDERYQALKRMFDTWCTLWFWPLQGGEMSADLPLAIAYPDLLNHFTGETPVTEFATPARLERWAETVEKLREQERFFHWELEFPDAFEVGGFDAIVGNPPWEQLKVNEREWFAGRVPEIADEEAAPSRFRKIEAMAQADPELYAQWRTALHRAEFQGGFIVGCKHFPFTGCGDLNTYPLFAELALALIVETGRAGMVVKTGLLVNETWCDFVRDLLENGKLAFALDFVNTKEIFRGLAPPERFALIGMMAAGDATQPVELAFLCTEQRDLDDPDRLYTLTAAEILAVNPNTANLPQFISAKDALLTARLYHTAPVLCHHEQKSNPWGMRYYTMFHMKNDAGYFADNTLEPLMEAGWELGRDGIFRRDGERMLPLYEAKLFDCYDHRNATFFGVPRANRFLRKATPKRTSVEDKADPSFEVVARFWVDENEFRSKVESLNWDCEWVFSMQDVTRSTTMQQAALGTVVPWLPLSNKAPAILFPQAESPARSCILFQAIFASLPFDYVVRQKLAGASLNLFILEQIAAPAPEHFDRELTVNGLTRTAADLAIDWALELICVTSSLMPLGREFGLTEPYAWDEDRRFHLRRLLDALMAHLYGMTRDDFDHALGHFRIINDNDMRDHGRLRTRETCLEYYDGLARGELEGVSGPSR